MQKKKRGKKKEKKKRNFVRVVAFKNTSQR